MAQKAKNAAEPVQVQSGQGLLAHLHETYDAIARRAYQLFEERGGEHGRSLDDWLRAETEFLQPLQSEFKSTEAGYELLTSLPGFRLEDLSVSIEDRNVVIQGRSRSTQRRGRAGASATMEQAREVLHVFPLPDDVQPDQVTATLEGDTLRIAMPRAQAPSRRRKPAA